MLFIHEYMKSFSSYYVFFCLFICLHKLHILKQTAKQLCDLFLGGTSLLPNLLQFKILGHCSLVMSLNWLLSVHITQRAKTTGSLEVSGIASSRFRFGGQIRCKLKNLKDTLSFLGVAKEVSKGNFLSLCTSTGVSTRIISD